MHKQRVAIVTGGSSGIGRAVAFALAQKGYSVLFTYRSWEGAQQTSKKIDEIWGYSVPVSCNIEDTAASQALVQRVMEQYGRLDILVNCAGISNTKTIEEIDEAEWDHMMDVNLKGTFFLTKAAFAHMKAAGYGRIVTLTSIAGQRGGKYSGVHYCASKAGLEAMSKCFARIGAEYGVTSNMVSPGVVETPMTAAEGVLPDDVPLGRMAQPEEVAAAVAFLASEQASYITGATLDVNGGQLMR